MKKKVLFNLIQFACNHDVVAEVINDSYHIINPNEMPKSSDFDIWKELCASLRVTYRQQFLIELLADAVKSEDYVQANHLRMELSSCFSLEVDVEELIRERLKDFAYSFNDYPLFAEFSLSASSLCEIWREYGIVSASTLLAWISEMEEILHTANPPEEVLSEVITCIEKDTYHPIMTVENIRVLITMVV